MAYTLSTNEITMINNLKNSGQYNVAYQYIASRIEGAVQNGSVTKETQRWFQWAEHINGNYDSFINNYARTYAKMGALMNGGVLTDTEFQTGSDIIANEVLNRIINDRTVPTTPKDIILVDIQIGAREMGTKPEDFPGAIIANLLFDTNTLGTLIWDQNTSFAQKFGTTLQQVIKHELLILVGGGKLGLEGLSSIISDPRHLGDLFDAARDIKNDGTFRDILGEISNDAKTFFANAARDYGWVINNPDTFLDGLGLLPNFLSPTKNLFNDVPAIPIMNWGGDPLVLDLNGNGIEVSKLGYGAGSSTTYFDMDNDGFAERTAWVKGGDGLLALDKNGNGKIDSQNELFGNNNNVADGFTNLKTLDSNNDNKITAADAQFANLRVWVDANADGKTDAGELKTLADLKITQINLGATLLTGIVNNENTVAATSSFVMNGSTKTVNDNEKRTRFLSEPLKEFA